jgi:ABC-2 type transport system permease protein
MTVLATITLTEGKLFLRERLTVFFTLLFPTVVFGVLASIPALRVPADGFGGARFIDYFIPSIVVMTLAMVAVNTMPTRLATYREKGVLRRMSTTPVHPGTVLVGQLVVNAAAAVVGTLVLVAFAWTVFDVPLPQHPLGFVVAYVLGGGALLALGLLAAALAPRANAVGATALPIFFLTMFFGGVYLLRFMLPEIVVRIGDYIPPGVQALHDAWTGTAPDPLQLVVMAAVGIAGAALAARSFRWE